MARKTIIWNPYTKIISFNPDNHHLMSVVQGSNSYLRQWTVGGTEVGSHRMMRSPARYIINAIAASMDGRWIVTGNAGNEVIVWDAVNHRIARQISEHTGQVSAVDVSSDSTRVASGSADSTVRIFSIISGIRLIPTLALGNAVTPTDIKFSSDGNQVATVAHSLCRIYDAHSGNKLFDFPVQNTSISSLAWSLDGQQLLVSSPGKITRFDTSTSSRFKSQWFINDTNNDYTTSVASYGRIIACATGLWVSFWDYTLGKQIGSIVDNTTVFNCIAISPDGRYLACGHEEGITLYHLADILPVDYLRIPRVPRIPLVHLDDQVLEPWTLGNLMDALSILSKEIQNAQDSGSSLHAHALAARSIIRARLRESRTAIEDAEMSLQIKQTPIGHIARSLALIGEQEVALDDFYLAFRDDPCDTTLLLVIESILLFMCGKCKRAVSRLEHLITTADEKTKGHYIPVLGSMYLKQRDYENAVQTLVHAKNPSTTQGSDPLMTITLIFDWNFDRLEDIAYQRLCESLYPSGRIKEVGETLLKMVSGLNEDEKEAAHGRILEELVTRSGQVTLLMWTGKSSRCNSCLPNSPAVYCDQALIPPGIEPAELEQRTDELRAVFSFADALMVYGQITRSQPVRFAHFRLHLPCIVFGVKRLERKGTNVYRAETVELGDVEFTTTDSIPLKEPQRLVFADLRIHRLRSELDTAWNSSNMEYSVAATDGNAELVHEPMIEEVPSEPQVEVDTYTRALRLIARLGQPFSALLLLGQSDGSYKRVAADHEIVVRARIGTSNIPKDIRVEVLEIV